MTSYDGKTITYDEIGNPLDYMGRTLSWEKGRQLASNKKDDVTTTYKYDINGLRTEKKVGSTTHEYTYVDDKLYAYEVGGHKMFFFYDENGTPSALVYNGSTYYYQTNLQGDVTGIVNYAGTKVASYSYDAWGNPVGQQPASGVGYYNPLRYRGYVYDADTNWYYLQSRYYDPETGRFLNADAPEMLGVGESVLKYNLFSYCDNNPVNKVDKDGYIAANIIGAAIGAVIGVVGGAFLGNWLADILKLKKWKRWAFVGSVSLLVGATASAIGYFIGLYVGKVATKLGEYVAQLVNEGKIALKKLAANERDSIKCLIKETCCFVAGTKVLAQEGHTPIEEIASGDLVWSQNPLTGEKGLKQVIGVTRKKTYEVVYVTTNDEQIVTTEEHPFWVVDKGWVKAGNLSRGDNLSLADGRNTEVLAIVIEYLREPIEVYNFEVEDWHTYYVSESDILVHNANCVKNYVRKSEAQIERMLDLKKGEFHRVIKDDILNCIDSKVKKRLGSNPDIYLARDGSIQLVSRVYKGVSEVVNLNIYDFIP